MILTLLVVCASRLKAAKNWISLTMHLHPPLQLAGMTQWCGLLLWLALVGCWLMLCVVQGPVSHDTPEKPSAPPKKSSMQSASMFDRQKKPKTVHVAAPAKRPSPAPTVRCKQHLAHRFIFFPQCICAVSLVSLSLIFVCIAPKKPRSQLEMRIWQALQEQTNLLKLRLPCFLRKFLHIGKLQSGVCQWSH